MDFSAFVYFLKSKRVNVNIVNSGTQKLQNSRVSNRRMWLFALKQKKMDVLYWFLASLLSLLLIFFSHCQNLLKSLSIKIHSDFLMKLFDEVGLESSAQKFKNLIRYDKLLLTFM